MNRYSPSQRNGRGPFRAEQLRPGDPYELSNGHPLECVPTGGRGSRANLVGGVALGTDPDVTSAGFDTGFTPEPGTLRAPDLAIGNVPDAAGWVSGAPPLAVEYADTGQDEADLAVKIRELLAAGSQQIWVVRLVGPRRVEVHRPDQPMRTVYPGEVLTAPGILRNPVPVEALYDPAAADDAALRNLLQRQGYESLDAVRDESAADAERRSLRSAVITVLESRGLTIDAPTRARIEGCADPAQLQRWLRRAATAASVADLFGAE